MSGISVGSMDDSGDPNNASGGGEDVGMCWIRTGIVPDRCYRGVGFNREPRAVLSVELGPNFGDQSIWPECAVVEHDRACRGSHIILLSSFVNGD